MVDYPARGRSAYVPLPGPDGKTPIDGNLNIRTALELERIWTNARERGDFPLKMNHTQWPGAGKIGDPIFDNFMQVAGAVRRREHGAGARRRRSRCSTRSAAPVILFTHSQGGGFGFEITEARPQLVKAMVSRRAGRSAVRQRRHGEGDGRTAQSEFVGADEHALRVRPAGERAGRSERRARGEVRAARRGAAAGCRWSRRASWRGGRTSACSRRVANGTYHRVYDPCIPKFLNQAGVKTDFVGSRTSASRATAT